MSQQKQTVYPSAPNENQTVLPRQVAFAAAFLLPLGKFLETPSLLARYAKGDILLPALFWFLIETLVLLTVLYAATRSEKTLSDACKHLSVKARWWCTHSLRYIICSPSCSRF